MKTELLIAAIALSVQLSEQAPVDQQMTSADGGEFIIEVKKEDEQKEEGRSPPKKHCKLPSRTGDSSQRNSSEDEDGESEKSYEEEEMPHREAMECVKDQVAQIIIGDPLLSDLHTAVTVEEVNSQIALLHGQAMTVCIRRADDIILPVVVLTGASVLDLKRAIQRHILLKQKREEGTTHISWSYVWRTYWLYYDTQRLTEENKSLKEYGIHNKSEVRFLKRLRHQ